MIYTPRAQARGCVNHIEINTEDISRSSFQTVHAIGQQPQKWSYDYISKDGSDWSGHVTSYII